MNLVYDDIQSEYRRSVRRFAENILRPLAEEAFDFSRPISYEEMGRMRAQIAPHDIGTSPPLNDRGGLDLICLGIFIEEISRINLGFATLCNALFFPIWDMESLLLGKQKDRYGHMFQPGEMVSLGLSEPGSGSNPSQLKTTATRVDDGWVINGQKLWTSHAVVAAGILVACNKVGDGESGTSLFMVDRREQKYDVRPIPCLGMSSSSTCEVTFDNCWVPPEADLTPGRGGMRSALGLVEQARLKIVFMAVGLGQAALDTAVTYAKVRTQFGKEIGAFQLVQAMLAEMATLVEASRMLAYRAASLFEAGEPARSVISMAKSYATESAVRVTSLGIQVHGGIGLTKECPAERYFRDARMLTIPDGTTQIHQLVIGRELTGLSAFK
jgi:alkylation response protein AidB-like acyl-CoA dehydrogenase